MANKIDDMKVRQKAYRDAYKVILKAKLERANWLQRLIIKNIIKDK